jgi:IS1 family transposase
MNRLSTAQRSHVVSCLVEGNSLRSTARVTGVARMTIEKLLMDIGKACAAYHDEHVYGLTCQRIQCDEIWSFCYAKRANVPASKQGVFGFGDIWTWTAIDADSKLIVSYLVGDRTLGTAQVFMQDVAHRVRNHIQLTTDGNRVYLTAVDYAFEGRTIDYSMLDKVYGSEDVPSGRYSPAKMLKSQKAVIKGNPDPRHISTSYVERQNLTMRMHMRRFTRLTNGFSKKWQNHADAVALHFMHYNFCRVHQTLRVTPAMEAGLADHVWSIEELIALIP